MRNSISLDLKHLTWSLFVSNSTLQCLELYKTIYFSYCLQYFMVGLHRRKRCKHIVARAVQQFTFRPQQQFQIAKAKLFSRYSGIETKRFEIIPTAIRLPNVQDEQRSIIPTEMKISKGICLRRRRDKSPRLFQSRDATPRARTHAVPPGWTEKTTGGTRSGSNFHSGRQSGNASRSGNRKKAVRPHLFEGSSSCRRRRRSSAEKRRLILNPFSLCRCDGELDKLQRDILLLFKNSVNKRRRHDKRRRFSDY